MSFGRSACPGVPSKNGHGRSRCKNSKKSANRYDRGDVAFQKHFSTFVLPEKHISTSHVEKIPLFFY
jgi:hypothetical protein